MISDKKNHVPIAKRSKKEQQAFHASKRGSWNGVVPITKIVPSGKRYVRTQEKAAIVKAAAERGATND